MSRLYNSALRVRSLGVLGVGGRGGGTAVVVEQISCQLLASTLAKLCTGISYLECEVEFRLTILSI